MVDEIFVRKHYEFDTIDEQPLILDCGANIGIATLYFKRRSPNAKIVAIEPDPRAFALLRQNVDANGLRGVELIPKALAAKPGTVELFLDAEHPLVASTRRDRVSERSRSVTVEAVPLSSLIDRTVAFLKLDVEGSEFTVLSELARSGKIAEVAQMAVEYHHHVSTDEDEFSCLLALLEQSGFGYQLIASEKEAREFGQFQDILVRAYRKPHQSGTPQRA
jgi:FkbM family methyltransferase